MALSHRQSINISNPKSTDATNPNTPLNKGSSFSKRQSQKSQNPCNNPQLLIEDFDDVLDSRFIKEYLGPYLSDLYKDLALRSFISTTSAGNG
jgi:hypothetical protein